MSPGGISWMYAARLSMAWGAANDRGIMGLGVSFKIAPGVRVRASSRGVRTSIGPRAARIHVGAGRTTFSTGAGPITVYTGGGRRRSGTSRAGTTRRTAGVSLAALEREARAAERAEQIASVARIEAALVTLHQEEFPAASRQVVPEPPPVDVTSILAARKKEGLEGVSWFARSARRAAKERAAELADSDARAAMARQQKEHASAQDAADAAWHDLCAHKPDVVMAVLEAAFEDNQSPAACVDVDGDGEVRYATVVVLFGTPDMVPENRPAVTPGGKPTLRKRSKTDRNALYAAALGSTVLATVKEGLAVAPSVDEIRVMVARRDPNAAVPSAYLSMIYAARFPRPFAEALPWSRLDPAEVLLRAPDALMERKGAARAIVALDLDLQPDLAGVLQQVRAGLQTD